MLRALMVANLAKSDRVDILTSARSHSRYLSPLRLYSPFAAIFSFSTMRPSVGWKSSTDSPARRRCRYSLISAWACGRSFFSISRRWAPRPKPSFSILKKAMVLVLLGQRLVEDQDRGLDAGIGLEHAGRQRDYGDEVLLHQHLA